MPPDDDLTLCTSVYNSVQPCVAKSSCAVELMVSWCSLRPVWVRSLQPPAGPFRLNLIPFNLQPPTHKHTIMTETAMLN